MVANPRAINRRESSPLFSRWAANTATNISGTAVHSTAGPNCAASRPRNESDCGMTRAVASNTKRNENSASAKAIVFHLRRYGRSTRGVWARIRRPVAHNTKSAPDATSAVKTPDRHQSSRCPWSIAARSSARPALRYKNPAKLGFGPDAWGRREAGTPKYTHAIMTGAMSADVQNIHV